MTALPATADLFETPTAVPDDVIIGLSVLLDRPPLWPISGPAWIEAVGVVRGFAERWHGEAHAAGWGVLALYGLHHSSPFANISAMGAAWVLARSGHRVVAVLPDVIRLKTRTAAALGIYRPELDRGAALPGAMRAPS
jgi:hypothetical protein